jgi:ribonuclease HI
LWKTSVIRLLLKPSRNPADAKSYRPIGLLPVLAKLLEKLLINRILWHLHSTGALSPFQYGFTPQRSAEDALVFVSQHIEEVLRRKHYCLLISLDVVGAYDHANWTIILQTLVNKRCPHNLYTLSEDYFRDRKAILQYGSHSYSHVLSKGCPQGSTSSPGFWIILYDGILRLPLPQHASLTCFADDALLMVDAPTIPVLEDLANSALLLITQWGLDNDIQFNPHKTNALVITRKRCTLNPNLFMEGTPLLVNQTLPYLGVTFDYRFSWSPHIQQVCVKTFRLITAIAKYSKVSYGINSQALKYLYTGAIEPKIVYGSAAWYSCLSKHCILKQLRRLQRLLALRIIRGYRTISYEAAILLADIPPIDLQILKKSWCYYIKHKMPIPILNLDSSLCCFQQPYETLPHPALAYALRDSSPSLLTDLSSRCHIYTDASRIQNNIGCAFGYFLDKTCLSAYQLKLQHHNTVFQAELLAIYQSLLHLPTQHMDYILFTDSYSALQAILNPSNSEILAAITRLLLIQLRRDNIDISLQYIQGHSNIFGNDIIDHLAKQAALSHLPTTPLYYPISHIKALLETWLYQEWNLQWHASPNAFLTKTFFPDITHHTLSAVSIGNPILTTFLTGHGNLQAYKSRFRISAIQNCPCCTGPQDVYHLIFLCPLLASIRNSLQSHLRLLSYSWPLPCADMFSTPELSHLFTAYFEDIFAHIPT